VRIQAGPNAGARWSLSAAGRHRTGRFEVDRMDAILALLRRGDCVWDIGAHHGYVTLAASSAVGPQGHVYAFEPSGYNYDYLIRHLRWNQRSNASPVNVGVAAAPGWVEFGGSGSSQTFHIGGGSERVEVTSIKQMMDGRFGRPDFVKIDVEGAEGSILDGGARHLPRSAAVVVSIHSRENYKMCVSALKAGGFQVYASEGARRIRHVDEPVTDDPDLIALGEGRRDLESVVRQLPGFSEA